MYGAPHILEGKLLGHHCAPSGCAKLDLCSHDVLVSLDGRARLSAVPNMDFFFKRHGWKLCPPALLQVRTRLQEADSI
jgi:hypothetical protein